MTGVKKTGADKLFDHINRIFLLTSMLIVLLPLIHVIAKSLSSSGEVISGHVFLWPKQFTLAAYKEILASKMLLIGYRNSFIYTIAGTVTNIFFTVICAYPLSRSDFRGRKQLMWIFVFTMIFSAPLIPTYLNISRLNMLDTIWAMILPNAINVYNMVVARTFFVNSIPVEMLEAAGLDGADDFKIIRHIVLPLSKSILAVLVLFYAVGHWNSYFDAYIYLSSEDKLPLQVILRNILANAKMVEQMANASVDQTERLAMVEVLKYAIIVFGSIPVIILYPFVQKHFVKGVMIGSLKG